MHLDKEFEKKMYFVRLTVLTNYPFYGYILDKFGIKIIDDSRITDSILVYNDVIFLNFNYALLKSIVVLAYRIYKELKNYISNLYYLPTGFLSNTNPKNDFLESNKYVFDDNITEKINDNSNKGKYEKKDDIQNKISDVLNDKSININYCDIPDHLRRLVKPVPYQKIDWKDILKDYLTYDLEDYDFCPPDRRFQDDFILPAFNEINETVKDIVFMIDVSESMDEVIIKKVFNEVREAFDSFRGRIKAYVGWFDVEVKEIIEIDDWDNNILNKIQGGGGTSFENLFNYIETSDFCDKIKSLIILTDGYSSFPQNYWRYEFDTIWIMTKEVKPLFGKYVKYEETK